MDNANIPLVETQPKFAKSGGIPSLKKPSINPPTTAKTTTAMEKRRKQMEDKRIKEEKNKKTEEDREKKLQTVNIGIIINAE